MNPGDEVMISQNSRYFRVGDRHNPADLTGIVVRWFDRYGNVRWSNGVVNSYAITDLEILE